MKHYAAAALIAIMVSGCASTVTKNFKVFADPADADVKVVSGAELKALKYRTPASVTAEVPKDPTLSSKAYLEVSRENYKPFTLLLRDIKDGQTVNVRLEKVVQSTFRYRLTCRLVAPSVSETLQFRDTTIAVSFEVGDQLFQMRLANLRDQEVKILWDQAQYTDVNNQMSRLMHTGVRFQDRNNAIADQVVPPRAAVQEGVIPVNKVVFSPQKKAYEIMSLFPVDTEAGAQLKGKTVNLFIPVEVDRAIIPYNFKIEILNAVKEDVKG